MEYRKEFRLDEFEFWSGAKGRYDEFFEQDKLKLLEDSIETAFEGQVPTDTDINDYVWFDEALHELVERRDEDNGTEEDGDDDL